MKNASGCARIMFFLIFTFLFPPFAFAASPVLFYSDLESGPKTGGQDNKGVFVTIWGKNFGSSRGSSYVAIGGGQADNYPVWTDTKISFQLGANAATGNITVTTSEGTSNGLPFTVRNGNIYFVDINVAGPGSGTYANPWKSPASWNNAAVAGDTCYFRAGTYGNTNYVGSGWYAVIGIDKGGTSGNPIAWVGYPGETATWNATGGGVEIVFRWTGNTMRFVTIAQMTMVANGECVSNNESGGSDDVRVVGNVCTGVLEGVYAPIDMNCHRVKILGNEIKNSGRLPIENQLHGIYVNYGSSDFEVAWNYLHDNRMGHQIQVHTDHAQRDGWVFTGSIHDNILTASDRSYARGINIGETDDGTTIDIYNNLIYHCGGGFSGICVYSGHIHMFNNTLYDLDADAVPIILNGEFSHGYTFTRTGEIRNNIIYNTGGNDYIVAINGNATMNDMTISRNCYYGIGNGPSQDSSPVNADPRLVNLVTSDFHLQSTSPCKDVGYNTASIVTKDHDGLSRPLGAGVDIGAYEYPLLTIVTSSLPNGIVNQAYSQNLEAEGGDIPYFWEIIDGPLPAGFSLSANTGVISGTPAVSETASFTVRVTDNNAEAVSKGLSIIINSTTTEPEAPIIGGVGGGGGGGGCFIATAVYGTYDAKEVVILRQFRDKYLLTNPLGRAFVKSYYEISPPIAEYIKKRVVNQKAAKVIINPFLFLIETIMNN